MIALYKYILEVNAKEEEELFKLKDNADTKANRLMDLSSINHGITERFGLEGTHRDHLQAGSSSTRSGCSKPHPTQF